MVPSPDIAIAVGRPTKPRSVRFATTSSAPGSLLALSGTLHI
jgi:hypothetical protein